MSLLTELELIRMANYKDVAPDGAGEKRRRAAADVLWFASGVFIKVVHTVCAA
jgi:hypothetical protein